MPSIVLRRKEGPFAGRCREVVLPSRLPGAIHPCKNPIGLDWRPPLGLLHLVVHLLQYAVRFHAPIGRSFGPFEFMVDDQAS